MLAPGVWSDNVPSSAIARPGSYRTLGGSIVTARKAPSLGIQTPMERARMLRKNATVQRHPPERCGFVMVIIGEPCARRKGHAEFTGGSHRSAEAMRDDAARRHAP